jgi:hypothetical protein
MEWNTVTWPFWTVLFQAGATRTQHRKWRKMNQFLQGFCLFFFKIAATLTKTNWKFYKCQHEHFIDVFHAKIYRFSSRDQQKIIFQQDACSGTHSPCNKDHFAFRLFLSLFCLLSILRRVFRTDISIEHEFLINVRSLGRNIVYCVIQNFIEADPLTPLLRDVIYENLSFENIFIKNIRTKNLCEVREGILMTYFAR